MDALRLYAPGTAPLTRLFARVRQFGGLRRLSIGPDAGRELVAGIDQDAIPPSVTTLGVFTGGTPAAWPKAVVLPRVTTLRTDAALRFTRDNFPNLRAVSLKPTASGTNLDAALSCPDLRELHLLTVPRDVFTRIGHLPLTGLGLLGGRLPTLDGIEGMTSLTRLRLHNLPSLTTIAPVGHLERLEEIQIRYCRRITDVDCLARLPRLRRLQVVACGDVGLSRIGAVLDRLDTVMISASA
ncbi:leucine-rich repeat domain-containing protein [Micromonospora sp. NPDC048170]|uniref:leucine-rich repeat domain-containing protein n=1 Tax=Micromonospora sp. NPDC048170 TaxID=3154819 RepID=UPI0033FD62B1